MRVRALLCLTACLIVAVLATGWRVMEAAPQARGGAIKGRIRLSGKAPGNSVIRMGVDPMCARINAGKQVVQEAVVTSADGGLANVFVTLQGPFPRTPAPHEPVTIDQQGCIYHPRVVGARVGQLLQVRNSDGFLHNVHSLSSRGNSFNLSEPGGRLYSFSLRDEEIMLQLKCDLHRWMTAYIGVVGHPYFAVSGGGGTFEILGVPAGTRKIQAWHERYGVLAQTVQVRAGAPTTVDFTYTGTERSVL